MLPSEGLDPLDFLRCLDASVARDRAPSALEGTVAFGVRHGPRDVWWRAQCQRGRAADASFVTHPPGSPKAMMLLGAAEADAILHGRALPRPAHVLFQGDRAVLRAFLVRYLRRRSMVDVRRHG